MGNQNPYLDYNFGGTTLTSVEEQSDLGVLFSKDLSFKDHIAKSVSKARSVSGWLLRTITIREKDVMVTLYKTFIRPHIEYCFSAWSPVPGYGGWALIDSLESVQKQFTARIYGFGNTNYRDRLKQLNLTTLLERRMRGDLIEIFKITKNYVNYGSNFFGESRSGRHTVAQSYNYRSSQRTKFFAQRSLHYWNRLPARVKDASSVNNFENRLDEFRRDGITNNITGHFWELSEMYLQRFYGGDF